MTGTPDQVAPFHSFNKTVHATLELRICYFISFFAEFRFPQMFGSFEHETTILFYESVNN